MSIQLVLFDLGGVLIELGGVEVFQRMIGAGSEAEVWRRWLTSKWVRAYERGQCDRMAFAEGMIEENDLQLGAEEFLETFRSWPRGLLPGAEALVSEIAPGLRCACLSNTNEMHWNEQADAAKVREFFDLCFPSHELGLVKPDREIYEHVIRETGLPADAILFLDDNAINVEGAQAAGLDAHLALGVEGARTILAEAGVLA
jgi:HAD superfamily hydrolase (TIGR01493 family)